MADATTPAENVAVVDDATHAAAETRKTARWIASALGAVPALGLATALVRAPGDAGFDPTLLSVGVIFVAGGALLALYLFADVLRPTAVSDAQLSGFQMSRVPAAPTTGEGRPLTAEETLQDINTARANVASREATVRQARLAVAQATARATALDAEATKLEADAKATQDPVLTKRAAAKRAETDQAQAVVGESTDGLEACKADVEEFSSELGRLRDVRVQMLLLKSADVVESRFLTAIRMLPVAVLIVAIGVVALAMAPKPPSEAATAPTLVTLTLNPAGQAALGCQVASLQAIRVGGDDAAPTVITMPTGTCESKLVEFKTDPTVGLGTVTEVEVIKPPTLTPTP